MTDGQPTPDAMQATIERLEARVTELEERHRSRPRGDGRGPTSDDRPNRRQLLTNGATMAAGALVGGAAIALSDASPAAAASGVFDGDPAVEATASPGSGTGIVAVSDSGDGLQASSLSGYGVRADSDSGIATYADSYTGYGVYGTSNLGTGVSAGCGPNGRSQLFLDSFDGGLPPPLARTDLHAAGELYRDFDDQLWFCVATGTPGTWRRLAGPSTAGAFVALPVPMRVYDSRPGLPPTGIGPKTPLPAKTPRTIDLKGNASGVPAGATAVLVNLIATGTTSALGGYMTIYPNGIAWPGTSNLNWSGPNETIAVTTVTAVDEDALCSVYAGSVTDVVVDVIGYYQ